MGNLEDLDNSLPFYGVDRTQWLNNPSCNTGVYLIESGEYYKIGKAENIRGRLSTIRTSNPHNPRLVSTYAPQQITKERLEQLLHEQFSSSREKDKGEWFRKEFTVGQFEAACIILSNRKARI